ncbi:RNA polymerase sigma factor [Alteraurantiacibacter palmitatis]|uniref:RNA polymerase sigma factor n=1 Tax=Alteraurantiacibacter palmitatis TaxID=2054628 RepID=A0ABV7E726_9SPHN
MAEGPLTDGELATMALSGRQSAYADLLARHREPIYRIVRGHIGDADEAVDVTQLAFIAAFAALDRYDRVRPFRHWLARIALNKCRDWARRRAVRRLLTGALPLGAAEAIADESVPQDVVLDDRQRLKDVMLAIARLPSRLKEALLLHTVEGLSQSETAALLGVSEKTVETRVYRARQKLNEILRGQSGAGVFPRTTDDEGPCS